MAAPLPFQRPPSPREEVYFPGGDIGLALAEVPRDHFFPPAQMRRRLEPYTQDQIERIVDDLAQIGADVFRETKEHREIWLATGAPLAGASTQLEALLRGGECPHGFLDRLMPRVYTDPFRSCLPHMQRTLLQDRVAGISESEAFATWRNASEVLSGVYLAMALKRGYAIADGALINAPYGKRALDEIKNKYGYQLTLIHMNCHESVRRQFWEKKKVSHWSEEEFDTKKEEFYAFLGYYVGTMNKILFCYRDEENRTIWAAKLEGRNLVIYDDRAFQAIQRLHAPELWEEAIGPCTILRFPLR